MVNLYEVIDATGLYMGDRSIDETTSLANDFDWDEIDVMDFVMTLENEVGVEILPEDAKDWCTIGDIITTLRERHGIEVYILDPG